MELLQMVLILTASKFLEDLKVLLWAKNSIGGAVLVNSKNPGEEWESKLRLAYDGFGSPGG
jgi:hypothetical protein